MKAVVMAGGEGTRLRPLTCNLPKPMVPILNIPIIQHGLNLLNSHGIDDICATLQYLPNKITEYFQDGTAFGIHMDYFVEDKPLGTAGSVKNACKSLSETFIVISGDALTDIDLTSAVSFHKSKGSLATLILKRAAIPLEYGVVVTEDDGKIVRFLEKPSWREVFSDTVNTGIYILEPEVLNDITEGEAKDFSKNIFPALLKKGAPLYGYITEDYWCDIGGIHSYIQAHYDVLDGRCRLPLIDVMKTETSGLWMGEKTILDDNVEMESPCFIGSHVHIAANSKIGAYTVLGNDVRIGEGSSFKKSIVWNSASFGKKAEVRGAVICNDAFMDDGSRIFEGSVIGADSKVGNNTHIKSGILIWPEKEIDPGSIISDNVVWNNDGKKCIDIYEGVIKGKIGTTMLPERIVVLARAIANHFGEDKTVLLCEDGSAPTLMIKQALAAGFASQGMQCYDIGTNPYTVAAITMREYPFHCGVCIYLENDICHILLLGSKGIPMSKDVERKIQNLLERRDIPCKDSDCIKTCQPMTGTQEKALNWIMDRVETRMIYKNKPMVAVDDKPNSGFIETCLKAAGCKTAKVDFSRYDYRKIMASSGCGLGLAQLNYFGSDNLALLGPDGSNVDPFSILGLKLTLLTNSSQYNHAVLPINTPDELVKLCKDAGKQPIFSKISLRDFMQSVQDSYPEEHLIFGTYFFNPLFALKLIEHISKRNTNLENMLSELPQYYLVQKSIPCMPKEYGSVMRNLARQTKTNDMPEGAKLDSDNGWALVLPDLESYSMKIFSHGTNEEYASEISENALMQVQKYLNQSDKDNNI